MVLKFKSKTCFHGLGVILNVTSIAIQSLLAKNFKEVFEVNRTILRPSPKVVSPISNPSKKFGKFLSKSPCNDDNK